MMFSSMQTVPEQVPSRCGSAVGGGRSWRSLPESESGKQTWLFDTTM